MHQTAIKYSTRQRITVTPDGQLTYSRSISPADKKKASGNGIRSYSPPRNTPTPPGAGAGEAAPSAPNPDSLAIDANSTAKKSPQKTPGFGILPRPTQFTSRARKSVRRAAGAIEREFGKENCYFFTGTLPGNTEAAMLAMALWSAWILDTMNKWLLRNYSIDGKCYRVGTWETQKRGALHLHLLFSLPPGAVLDEVREAFQRKWWNLLQEVGRRENVDMFERSSGGSWEWDSRARDGRYIRDFSGNVQRVEKSVTAYLAKYLSKGSGEYKYYPSRWWSVSDCVRKLIAKHTISYTLPRCTWEQSEECDSVVREYLEATFPGACAQSLRFHPGGDNIPCGWVAWSDDYEKLKECAKELNEILSGHLEYLGVPPAVRASRKAEALEPLRAANIFREKQRIESAEEALDNYRESSISRQISRAKAGVIVDAQLRMELRKLREQIEDDFANEKKM